MSTSSGTRLGLLILLVIGIGGGATYLIGSHFAAPPEEEPEVAAPVPAPPAPAPTAKAPDTPRPPTIPEVVQHAQNPTPPTPAQEEEEEQTEEDQIAAAKNSLQSADVTERVDGAEQLGAYPSPESEALLNQALLSDAAPEVRSAAAQSLGVFDELSQGSMDALLTALEDNNEDVRIDSLSTLEDVLSRYEEGSAQEKKLLGDLKKKAAARSVPNDTRTALKEILQDYAENNR